jgi:NAD-dependent SIR2 family protein deacetylase
MAREKPDRNVYILGAGFSAPAGAPVIRNFLDLSREFYDNPRSSIDEEERARFGRVFKFKRSMGQARERVRIDLDNIENLFGLAEISTRLGIDIGKTRKDIVYLIAKTLHIATSWPKFPRPRLQFSLNAKCGYLSTQFHNVFQSIGEQRFGADMYDWFAAIVAGILDDPDQRSARKDTIITFNYDLLCETSLKKLGVEINYHLKEGIDASVEAKTSGLSVDLLKLHGSTNWGICTNCANSVTILSGDLTNDPFLLSLETCKECNARAFEPLLVPPSWDKSEHQAIVRHVWKRAVEELRQATRIFIIGYSMPETDAFFQYLLTLALSENEGLYKLAVVDLVENDRNSTESGGAIPKPQNHVESRYRNMLDPMFQERRFLFNPSGVLDFLGSNYSFRELERGEGVKELGY